MLQYGIVHDEVKRGASGFFNDCLQTMKINLSHCDETSAEFSFALPSFLEDAF
jgi:hypothetical protein